MASCLLVYRSYVTSPYNTSVILYSESSVAACCDLLLQAHSLQDSQTCVAHRTCSFTQSLHIMFHSVTNVPAEIVAAAVLHLAEA